LALNVPSRKIGQSNHSVEYPKPAIQAAKILSLQISLVFGPPSVLWSGSERAICFAYRVLRSFVMHFSFLLGHIGILTGHEGPPDIRQDQLAGDQLRVQKDDWRCKSSILVLEEDAPVRCVGEEFQNFSRVRAEKSPARFELKFRF